MTLEVCLSLVCRSLAVLLLLLSTLARAQPVARELKRQRVVVTGMAGAPVPVLRVAPGMATLLLFDSRLAPEGLELESRATRFERVDVAERSLTVVPSTELASGERLMLTVHFADGMFPRQAAFALVGHAREVDVQVDVARTPLSSEVLHAELTELRARCAVTEAGLAVLRAQCRASGLAGAIFSGVVGPTGIVARLLLELPAAKGVKVAGPYYLYRSGRWFWLDVWLRNPQGQSPWAPGAARVMQLGKDAPPQEAWKPVQVQMDSHEVAPDGSGHLVIEWEQPEDEVKGAVSLEVMDVDGTRGLRWQRLDLSIPES